MRAVNRLACLLVCCVLFAGCGASRYRTVTVPPRVDLGPHETIGVIEFASPTAAGLAPLATRRFVESARRDQGLVRMLDLGSVADARPDPEAIRELGRRHGVQTMFVGELTVSDVRPELQLSAALKSGSVDALVDATLAVTLVETSTGASIWSASARASRSVGGVSVAHGKFWTFDAPDPDRAYGDLVDALVETAARDFHAGWRRVRVE